MSAAYVLFLMLGCVTLTLSTSLAAPTQQTPPDSSTNTVSAPPHGAEHAPPVDGTNGQKEGKPSEGRQDDRKVSGTNPHRTSANTIKIGPKQPPNNRVRPQSGNPTNLHKPGTDKSGRAAKSALMQHETVNSALPVRSAKVIRPTVPSLNHVHHHGANPAVIGGSANSAGKTAGAIGGTGAHHKP